MTDGGAFNMHAAHRHEDGTVQLLREHLEGTAALAEQFASVFGAGSWGRQVGLAHDIGKYSEQAQMRILHNGPKVDHSTAGAKELFRQNMAAAAACVAGHHAGLPDFGQQTDSPDQSTLFGRIKRKLPEYSSFSNEIELSNHPLPLCSGKGTYEGAFFIRMLFSCLVDADYLDTEAFMQNNAVSRGKFDSLSVLLSRLMLSIEPWWNTDSAINQKRCEVLRNCIDASSGSRGFYSLTVPTGGGKTIASLAFALHHAVKHKLDRVIYVIPYTSIIEQTADIFRSRLGVNNIIEHHSGCSFDIPDEDDGLSDVNKHYLATENWDAPIIITTNVQFFESIYGNRSSQCRKLHNIAKSVVVFDEAQMIPLPYLRPCIAAVASLVNNYNSTAILCTATQPAIQAILPQGMNITENCPNVTDLFRFFRRTTITHVGKLANEALAEKMQSNNQALSIVSTRKQAADIYRRLTDVTAYHLSTMMYPAHRRRVLKEIRDQLAKGEPCLLVSTSLVEAGVDLDFPVVFRAEAGIDSVIQAAGRCNREGKRSAESSVVSIFESDSRPPAILQQGISMLHEIMRLYPDFTSPSAIEAYFKAIYDIKGEMLDAKSIIQSIEKGREGCLLPFRQIAKAIKFIETDTKQVLIPIENEAKKLVDQMNHGFFNRSIIRKAGQYIVSVYENEYNELVYSGAVEVIATDLAVLTDLNRYSDSTGLSVSFEQGRALFS
jgi:CRISPR-associated endonuclease/helicase Cas3